MTGLTMNRLEGELEPLENLLTPECLKIVKENLSLFSMSQRQRLSLEPEDVTSSFIYQIGILMNDEEEENRKRPFIWYKLRHQ